MNILAISPRNSSFDGVKPHVRFSSSSRWSITGGVFNPSHSYWKMINQIADRPTTCFPEGQRSPFSGTKPKHHIGGYIPIIYIIIHLLYYILYMYIFSILHHYILCISPLSPVNPHCDRRLLIHRSIDPAGSCRCLRAEWQCPCGFVEQAAGPLTLRGWDPAGRIWFQRCSHSSDMLLEMYIFYLLKRMTACMYIYTHNHIYTSSTAQGGGGSFRNRKPIGEVGCCESRMAERIH